MPAKPLLTYEELVNSYEWKLTEKVLKRAFPWIKGISVSPERINDYNTIFVDIIFNPYELAEEKEWEISWYVVKNIEDGSAKFPLLATFYNKSFNEVKDEVMDDINDTLVSVKNSNAVPGELKLPSKRILQAGNFISDSNLKKLEK